MTEFPEHMPLGERIRLRRKEHGLSQAALAERFGVTQNAVSGWENGSEPQRDKFKAIGKFIGSSEADIARLVTMPRRHDERPIAAASGIRIPTDLTDDELDQLQAMIDAGIAGLRQRRR